MAQSDKIEEKEILPHNMQKAVSGILLKYETNIFHIKRQKIFHVMHNIWQIRLRNNLWLIKHLVYFLLEI